MHCLIRFSSTTGGNGGATTTVSTLAQFTAAVSGDSAAVVVVTGTITGAAKVRVGSNKTIIGSNASKYTDVIQNTVY
jgi:pectate lyase